MKIKSVQVHTQQHPPEDGTSSTYSIEEAPVDYERTVASLTQALTELHRELRDRTTENEALLATASSLSNSLQQSDVLLQEKSLECERLYLKLQMVTFVERNDSSSSRSLCVDEHEFDADFGNRSMPVDLDEDVDVSSTARSASSSSQTKQSTKHKKKSKKPGQEVNKPKQQQQQQPLSLSGPVSVDDCDESSPEIGPRQAHFYNVMLERDRALHNAKKLKKELKDSKHKLKELQAKLDRSNLLVEISYHHEEQQKKKKQQQQRKDEQRQELVSTVEATNVAPIDNVPLDAQESPPSSKRLLTRKWLRKSGTSARKHSKEEYSSSTFKTLEEEKLPSKWNNAVSKNEAAYLDAIAANDADRAGGHDSIRFQL